MSSDDNNLQSLRAVAPRVQKLFSARGGKARIAFRYAAHAYAGLDRHMDEAAALTGWLAKSARALGLSDAQAPRDEQLARAKPGVPVTVEAWREVGRSLEAGRRIAAQDPATDAGRWCSAVALALRLGPIEADILALAMHYTFDRSTKMLFEALSSAGHGRTRFHVAPYLIALLLGEPASDIQAHLATSARLQSSGLLTADEDSDLNILPRLHLLVGRASPLGPDLASQLLGSTAPDPLDWRSFAHLGREAETAAALLRAALAQREVGVNILLYGPPGTGKTSFAASLAARVGAPLRSVTETDDDGAEPTRSDRLAGLRLAQHLLPPGSAVLLFDEAEDVFGAHTDHRGNVSQGSRVFMHRLLEQTRVPVIWTANSVGVLGPAVLRRMTLCIELALPNVAARTRLWQEMGEAEGVILPDGEAARLARLVPAAPAVARTALRGARLAGGGADTARLIVEGVARAVAGGSLPPPEPEETLYDPSLVNADIDLELLAGQLTRPDATRHVSLLLSGPPGSGKSAWIRHLATRIGMPVVHKRASDLLNCFVGGTEAHIAAAFAEARAAEAVLVFEEADSLLLDRENAVRSWEVSQVNEMLSWMDSHPLPFACTTNLLSRLDGASLRRFLFKARFDWLSPAQCRLAFRRLFALEPPPELDNLRALSPADFALVRRRAALLETDASGLVDLLAAECAGRPGARVPIGFR